MNSDKFPVNFNKNNDNILKAEDILNELERNKINSDLIIFRKLLTSPLEIFDETWKPVMFKLLNVIIDNNQGHMDQCRLASSAFITIFIAHHNVDEQKNYLEKMLNLKSKQLNIFNEEFYIQDVELFKLIIIHGYFFANIKVSILFDIFIMSFDIIRKNCMVYTKYTYFSFKLLEIWLKISRDIEFWNGNNREIEKNMEAIIFSNWDNCINEITKINVSNIFSVYLKIMQDKYNGFVEYALKTLIEHSSWQNSNKYIITAEICKIYHNYPQIPDLELNIFQSITKNHLRHAGTKLYLTLLEKTDREQWNKFIRNHLYSNAKKWESDDNIGALHILWELWMKPTLIKFRCELIPSLWVEFCTDQTIISSSYLAKIASELGITWTQLNSQSQIDCNNAHSLAIKKYWSICKITKVPCIIDVAEECVKLNVFIAYCRMNDFLNQNDNYELCKRVLYCNANSCSTQFRKGLFDNFKILFERVGKIRGNVEISFVNWLYYFILDCFEPGSCYQRKIIGIKLYEIILMYTSEKDKIDNEKKNKKKFQDGVLLKEYMKNAQKWNMDNNLTLSILLRLCLDPIDEIRDYSFKIINNYFDINILTKKEIEILTIKSTEMNKSTKFYEIASGAKLLLIINKYKNINFHNQLHKILFERAKISLEFIKQDFLNALTEGNEFNAALLALLEFDFYEVLENLPDDFFQNLLILMHDSTKFFLSALSPKASDVSYSSSFAEMGIAIEETIKTSAVTYEFDENIISPAHQIVLSCIWMALKTLCDLASKISILTNSYENIEQSMELIVSVLMKCRHKGAIESAGVALGISIHHLSSKKKYYHLIDTYLDKLLSLNSNDKIDLTRRGAGLSIMFHKMLSNDDKKTRRLLHVATNRLIQSLRVPIIKPCTEIGPNQDCVCARQLHFLRTIVADKTLHPHLVSYMEEISMICFEHLQSLEWAIRNASLQLLGALIPRIVGHPPESELDFGNGSSFNHFFTHYPRLAEFVLQRIKHPSALNIDSNIVPIVTLISKMSVGGCDFIDYSCQEYIIHLKNAIRLLFGHTVDHVRYVAAKSYAALVSIREIPQELLNMKMENLVDKNRNFIHGHLMAQICLQLLANHAGIWLNIFSNNKYNMEILLKGSDIQLKRVKSMLDYWLIDVEKYDKKSLCNIIESTFLQSFTMPPFWSTINNEVFNKIILYNQFITIAENVSVKNTIGHSEFINQLYKLNSLYYKNWKSNFDFLNFDFINIFNQSIYPDIRYYSIKYLSKNIIDMHTKKYCTINSIVKLFQFILESLTKQNSNDLNVIIEICNIIICVLIYEKKSCCHVDYEPEKIYFLHKLYSPNDVMKLLMKYYKNRKVHNLAYKIILLIAQLMKISPPICVQNNIKYLIDNGDEQERIWAIDLLIIHQSDEYCWYYDKNINPDGYMLKSLITLLSDENEKVRSILYEIMRVNKWPNNWYYFTVNVVDPVVCCIDCSHYPYEYEKFLIPKNLQLFLHNAIYTLAERFPILSLYNNLKWMPHIVERKIISNKIVLDSPFDQDETYREITKTFNIYYYFLNNDIANWPCPLQPIDCDGIIKCSNKFFQNYTNYLRDINSNSDNLYCVLNFKVIDYLYYKAKIYEKEFFLKYEGKFKNDIN